MTRLMRRLGHYRWFAALGRRFGSRLDRLLYRASSGRLSSVGAVVPVLLLTTKGRKTGKPRTTPVMYLRDGERFLVTCENFGQRRSAAWPLNLEHDPHATIQVGSERLRCRARRLGEDEAEGHWPRFVSAWPAHATYRERTRVRRMFALEPTEAEER